MKFYELGLRRAPNAVKGPVAARIAPLVFKGLSGYQAAFSWDRGSEIVYRVSNGLYVYGFILNVGNSVGPTERQATYQALQSFTVTK